MIEKLDVLEWLSLNAQLQRKKNALRTALSERGVLKREGKNTYDKYSYFSEAQYKVLFTELFAKHGLEFKFTEVDYVAFEGSEKMANGRMPKLKFSLIDMDTGFYEDSVITGEGIDKGDKAGYKGYTGALKYYLANTFMVATGDDPETESPDNRMNNVNVKKASAYQIEKLKTYYTGVNMDRLLEKNGLKRIEDISMAKASQLIEKLEKNNG